LILMMKFDLSYDPPAPIAKIAIRTTESGKRLRDLEMLLDTGSDITLLSKERLHELGIAPSNKKEYELVGFDGRIIKSEIYHLQVIFLGKRFIGNYCAVDNPVGILGRDILNQITILLDGPNLEWDEIQTPSLK
jgi:predicted aspartyl protease